MHLLIIYTGEFKTKVFPLGGKFELDQALILKKSGIKVGILAPGLLSVRRLLKSYPYNPHQIYEGVPVLRSFKKNLFPARINLYNLLLAKKYKSFGLNLFKKYIKIYGSPDLIHAIDIRFGAYVASEISDRYNIPFITSEYSSELAENTFPKSLKKSIIPILKKSKFVSAASKPFANVVKKKLGLKKKVYPFYPVLPLDIFEEKIIKKKIKKKKFIFLTVNRLDENKNIKLILEAFSREFRKKSAILKVVGDGVLLKSLKKLSINLNINKQIIFINKASRESMKKEMRNADCFLSSSFHETFGVVLIEALAYGIPVISTNSEGAREILNKFNGILINQNDLLGYKNAMLKIFLGKFKYKKIKLRKDIINRFGPSKFVQNAKEIYKKVLTK